MAAVDTVRVERSQRRKAVFASTVGTTIEWYDFFLYNTAAALVFPKLFFPGGDEFAGILLAFGTQFVGFAARPIGAAVFGHYGDRIGRKATLVVTLLMMGIGTALIGMLPSYAAIGIAAPLLLTVLRIVQGVAVGGEWGGSVLLAMEWGSPKRRGFFASWPQLGVPLGLLLSTALVSILSATTGDAFLQWGWRIPFLASLILVAIGLYVRLRVLESPEFAAVRERQGVARNPFAQAWKGQWREILTSAFVRMAEQAPFYIFITFVLTYGTKQLELPRSQLLNATLVASAVGLISVPLFGWLSDLIGRRLMYAIGVVCTALFAFPYFGLLDTKVAGFVLLAIVVSLIFHDMQYGPQAALIAESFGTNIRYSGAGIGYQLASVIAGGPAPLLAAYILDATGSSTLISVYIVGCCVVSLIALAFMPRVAPEAADKSVDAAVRHG
ncbi:MFS transporter [Pseudonocardia endophytica]|uniref:Putative proline/betaine transporter n=1 Tax=Pseudonocardia endophytica TaxID=401976 RepID=A0A4R1HY60_PSEEN|nr:MFS transporter [Pseudonocardia endophytica]TCK27328.1 metabolite-proton symporter [Pseudonocardia endophytica]